MKVIHLATSKHGGAGIAAARLSSALNSIGIESELLTRFDYGNLKKDRAELFLSLIHI